jgi:hypothetical protein
MEDSQPFGYTHRHKVGSAAAPRTANNSSECALTAHSQRSHAQMQEQERSASPAWSSSLNYNHSNAQDPSGQLHHSRFCPNQRAPLDLRFYARRSSPEQPRHTPAADSAARQHTSGLHLPRLDNMASSAPRRYAGDGFDFRRPAGYRQEQEEARPLGFGEQDEAHVDLSRDEDIIDLTADDSGYGPSQGSANNNEEHRTRPPPRLPRGMDIVINLDNGDEDWTPTVQRAGSPEIEFISSRALPPRRDDEVEFVRSQPLPVDEQRRRREEQLDRALDLLGSNDIGGRFQHLHAQLNRFHTEVHRQAADLRSARAPVVPPRNASHGRPRVHVGFAPPGMLDFGMVGFDMNNARNVPPPHAPTYPAPPDAPDGFTRSPEEEGELVCPNCEEELCIGEDDLKKQVWIVRYCGHVSLKTLEVVFWMLILVAGLLRRVRGKSLCQAQFERQREACKDEAVQGVCRRGVHQESHEPKVYVSGLLVVCCFACRSDYSDHAFPQQLDTRPACTSPFVFGICCICMAWHGTALQLRLQLRLYTTRFSCMAFQQVGGRMVFNLFLFLRSYG